MYLDSHLHIGMYPEPIKTLKYMLGENILPVAVSIHQQEALKLLGLLKEQQLSIPLFIGVHPWYAHENLDIKLFDTIIQNENVCGIGECGLDNKIDLPLKAQLELLEIHLELSANYQLPLNLHIRGCHGQLVAMLKKYNGKCRGIVHNFTFSKEQAKAYLDLGYKLSMGLNLLEQRQKHLECAKYVGIKNLLLETDGDYLHSKDYDIKLIKNEYQILAKLFSLDIEPLKSVLLDNFNELLGKKYEFNLPCQERS